MKTVVIYALILLTYVPCSFAEITCPPMPSAVTEVNRDVSTDIQASAASLGKVKAGEVAAKTKVTAKNLFVKYPNVDKIITLQTMAATYCTMLRDMATISDKEKLNRWERFQNEVLNQTRTIPIKSPSERTKRENTDSITIKKVGTNVTATIGGEVNSQKHQDMLPQDKQTGTRDESEKQQDRLLIAKTRVELIYEHKDGKVEKLANDIKNVMLKMGFQEVTMNTVDNWDKDARGRWRSKNMGGCPSPPRETIVAGRRSQDKIDVIGAALSTNQIEKQLNKIEQTDYNRPFYNVGDDQVLIMLR